MRDLVFLALTVAFFLVAVLMVRGCEPSCDPSRRSTTRPARERRERDRLRARRRRAGVSMRSSRPRSWDDARARGAILALFWVGIAFGVAFLVSLFLEPWR